MNTIDKKMIFLINDIKKDIISTRNQVLTDANRELIFMYFRIGKVISENARYGSDFINTLSASLKIEFPDTTGFSSRNLTRMKKFYETYKDLSNLPTPLANLPWSFNCLLIDKIKDEDKRIWYAENCIENGWSYVVLNHQIDLQLFERQADNDIKLSNYAYRFTSVQCELALNMMKDPFFPFFVQTATGKH